MRTRNIDVAAYLHLNGVAPIEIRFVAENVREFTYRDREAAPLVRAFMRGAMVPARQFAEARAAVKRATHGEHHQQTAFGMALRQALEKREPRQRESA